jgi:hypothetical protein
MTMLSLVNMSDSDLTLAVGRLAGGERTATAALVAHLAEFDARRLYEGAGYPSLFKYCVDVLRLSEDAAYNRIETARAARRFPAIVGMLESGTLSLTTARELARHLTQENHAELLVAASGRNKQQVEELLAARFPRPDIAGTVRKVPVRTPAPVMGEPAPVAGAAMDGGSAVGGVMSPVPVVSPAPPSRPALVRPTAPARYEIRFTARQETRDKLRRAQDLLSHAVPSGDIAEVVDRALTLLVADLERRKFAATPRPRPRVAHKAAVDTVPAEVRRAVWARDQGGCAFVSKSGHRCGAKRFVEFHHLVPRAVGGLATVDNIELRCRAHNGHEVDLFFGPGVRWTREGRERDLALRRDGEERTRSGTS